MCLFVAGILDPAHADQIAASSTTRLSAHPTHPAYGSPASLARARSRAQPFFGGGCVVVPRDADVATPPSATDEAAYTAPLDFYGAYHVPFFATYALCEHAALLASEGDRAGAGALLEPVANGRRIARGCWTRSHARSDLANLRRESRSHDASQLPRAVQSMPSADGEA